MSKSFNQALVIIEDWVPATILVVMTLIVITDVSGRYVLNFTVPGAAELATAMFVWLVFLGSAGAVRRYQHIAVDTVVAYLPSRVRPAIQLAGTLAILAISVYIAQLSIKLSLQSWDREIEVLHLSYFYVYVVVPICFVLIAYHSCVQIVDLLRNWTEAEGFRCRAPTDVEV